jgi:hypothetical protein
MLLLKAANKFIERPFVAYSVEKLDKNGGLFFCKNQNILISA